MTENSYTYKNDRPEPVRLFPYPPQAPDKKLVIGNFQYAQKRPERPPYHYPPPQQGAPVQFWQQGAQGGSTMPASNPNSPSYPYQQPLQAAGNSGSGPTPQRSPRRPRGCLVACLVVLLLLCVVGDFTAVTAH